jgi:large subunit ribosomal protein L16
VKTLTQALASTQTGILTLAYSTPMLLPKKTKHRKWQRGRSKNRMVETRGTSLAFGQVGLKSLGLAHLDSRQIEAARRAITNYLKREGRLWIRVFPDRPVTARPPELTMGGGKGSVNHYVMVVRPGRIIFEMDGADLKKMKEALLRAGYKLPFRSILISK